MIHLSKFIYVQFLLFKKYLVLEFYKQVITDW